MSRVAGHAAGPAYNLDRNIHSLIIRPVEGQPLTIDNLARPSFLIFISSADLIAATIMHNASLRF